jgi:peptidoglycan/xylan/chitin deacetylase (PgdA/CDA1 family)
MRWYQKVSIALLVLLLIPLSPIYPAKECHSEGHQTLVALTFDDGYGCWTSTILPILERYDLVATAFIFEPDYRLDFYWSDVRELYDAGWEIGWHTATHMQIDIADQSEIISDFSACGALFEEHGLPSPVSFAYPFGKHDFRSMEIVSDYFLAARTTHQGVNSPCYIQENPVHLKAISVQRGTDFLEKIINENIGRDVLIVFLGHRVEYDISDAPYTAISAAELEDLAEFLHQEEEKGQISVVTFSEGVHRMQQVEATSSWGIEIGSPFSSWSKVYILPVPERYFFLYQWIVEDFIGHRFPQVERLFDRLLSGPRHIGFYLILGIILFLLVSLMVTLMKLKKRFASRAEVNP